MITITTESHFWDWFQTHQAIFVELEKLEEEERKYWQEELATRLNACCNRTLTKVQSGAASGLHSFVVRQSHHDRHNEKLLALAQAAPVIPGWQIVFTGEMTVFKYPEADTLYWDYVEGVDEEGRPGFIVYVPLEGEVPEAMKATVESMVNTLLSEAGCQLDLAAIAVEDLSELPVGANLLTLAQLSHYLQQNRQAP